MDTELKSGFIKRNDHMLQAAWLSSFSSEKKEDKLRESLLCIYNIKSKKYLKQTCSNVMKSDYLIENDIDDSYVKEIEGFVAKLLGKDRGFSNVGEYIESLVLKIDDADTKFLIGFLSLLSSRNKILLLDNVIKLEKHPNSIKNDLELLFLSNQLIKLRFDKNIDIINSLKKPIFRIAKIKNRVLNEFSINGIALIGESPVFKINNFIPCEQQIMKMVAIELSNEQLVNKHWEKFCNSYIFPLSWNSLVILHEQGDIKDIKDSEYGKMMEILITLYEQNQVLCCDKELIINPLLYESEGLKSFIDNIIEKITPLIIERHDLYERLRKAIK